MSAGAFCPKCSGSVTAGGCNPAMDRCVSPGTESDGATYGACRPFELEGQREPVHIEEERRAEFDVDCTPLPVIEQTLRGVLAGWARVQRVPIHSGEGAPTAPPPVLRVLDVCAGYGPWSKVLRRLAADPDNVFPVHITGLEVREECRPYLNRNCNRTIIEDAAKLIPGLAQRYDLVMGNITFSLPDAKAKRERNKSGDLVMGKSRVMAHKVFVDHGRQLLAGLESRLALFVPTDWTGRSGPLAKLAQDHVPMFELYQAGPVGFRLNEGTDTRTYKTAVWGHPSLPAVKWTKKRTLPILGLEGRTLKGLYLPGTEP